MTFPAWKDYFNLTQGSTRSIPVHITGPGKSLVFTGESARLGLYPTFYFHGPDNDFPEHTHRFFEIFMVLSGKGVNHSAGEDFPIAAGDVVFIDNRRPHVLRSNARGMEILNLCFLPSSIGLDDGLLSNTGRLDFYDFLRPFKAAGKDEPGAKITPSPGFFSRLSFHALHMVEIFNLEEPGNETLLHHQMQLILFMLLREYRRLMGPGHGTGGAMLEAAQYIQTHASEKISLESLADRLGMSRSHFSTCFNRMFGKRLPDFLNEARLKQAKALLATTDLPVLQVALESGFENKAHFHYVFRRETGTTPMAWRESQRTTPGK